MFLAGNFENVYVKKKRKRYANIYIRNVKRLRPIYAPDYNRHQSYTMSYKYMGSVITEDVAKAQFQRQLTVF